MPEIVQQKLTDALVRSAPIGIAILDGDLRYRYINEHLAAMNGVPVASTIGRTIAEVIGEAMAAMIAPRLQRVIETGLPVSTRSNGVLPPASGQLRHFESHNHALRDETGEIIGVGCYVVEITAQVEAENARDRAVGDLEVRTRSELERSRIQLEEAQAIAQLGSWEADLTTGVVTWSREQCRMYGLDSDFPASYEAWLGLVHPDDRAHVIAVASSALSGTPADFEYRAVRPTGEVRIIAARNRVVRDGDGKPVRLLGTSQDVTDQRAMASRLQVTDRLASLGTLAAGLAHEINNPLAYALGNVDLVLEGMAAMASTGLPAAALQRVAALRELLTLAAEGGSRVRTIVRDMKLFARGESEAGGEIDVRPVVESAVTLASNEIRHRARLQVAHGPAPRVRGNASRLGQVVLNLLVNAAQAIPDGRPDHEEIHVGTFSDEQGRAVIEVRDTGVGIAPENLRRIFDPFYTTKQVGTGTGLGLSICHGIVQSFGGEMTVDSEPGCGTRFRVLLPGVAPAPAAEVKREAVAAAQRVLIVDDEPQLVAFSKRCLTGRCDAVTATDPREALERLGQGEDFDLILCDVMMPRLSGIDLFERVTAERPELAERFVFMSGGAFTPRAQEFMEAKGRARLDKPFTPTQLRALVEERLRPKAGAAPAEAVAPSPAPHDSPPRSAGAR